MRRIHLADRMYGEVPETRHMIRIAFNSALLTTALLAASVGAQQTNSRRLGPADGLLSVTVDGKHGFIDLTGRLVIPPTFDFAWGFSEGLASAWQNGRAGFIDRTGRFVISPRFEYAKAFHEGLAEVKLGGLWPSLASAGIDLLLTHARQKDPGRAETLLRDVEDAVDKAVRAGSNSFALTDKTGQSGNETRPISFPMPGEAVGLCCSS
jgi:hypothetical protein